ncbi:MAG: MgtC/SapB family protein [Candidatus Nitricoxidivorans perseverans]|uniref:MgtC/SapB family protein n=1 Tax=Candidatus Nitricoxidivorans perseverans TaxID=2975601 RepID=A0AA49J069_9PROT|nr:MAG: MgtC/SapB family protein [Candidatus Nitricoxidivorans perseverans]
MDFLGQTPPEHIETFATSLAIGLLIGLERERQPDTKAGLRTFALVALLGTLSGLIATATGAGWILAAGLLAVGATMIAALAVDPLDSGDPGTTSVIAMMVCYGLGAVVWFGHGTLAVMLAIATTLLLYFKTELHGWSRNLTRKDLISILQFAVLSFVILPILPNRDFGPFDALNPHQIWLMVVLISGVSLAGYAALRFVGVRHGAPVIGFFGGLVSSTATTMVFARHARGEEGFIRTATVVILLANLVVMLRLCLVAAIVAPGLLPTLAMVLGGGLILGLAVTAWSWRSLGAHGELPMPEVRNPTEIRTALSFGLLYAAVLFLAALLEDAAGSKGLYLVALASGLTDVDAITLSSLRLHNLEKLAAQQAVFSVALATLSNLAFKSGLVIAIGGGPLARRALPGLLAIAAGIAAGMFFVA